MVSNAATGTAWFRRLVERAAQVRFTTGRIGFIHPGTGKAIDGNNQAQAVFVFSHSRKYKEKVIWFNV